MKNTPRFIFIIFLLFGSVLYAQQNEYPKFVQNDYDTAYYTVSINTYVHGELLVKVINILNKKYHNSCDKAWLEVYKNNKRIFGNYFGSNELDASGDYGGLYAPQPPIPQPWFAVVKLGSYDGNLYLINTNGTVKKMIGGNYFITKNSKYLFSIYRSDISGVAVFDLHKGKIIYSSTDSLYYYQWYRDKDKYFFTSAGYINEAQEWYEIKDNGYYFDFNKKRFIKSKIDKSLLDNSHKIKLSTFNK